MTDVVDANAGKRAYICGVTDLAAQVATLHAGMHSCADAWYTDDPTYSGRVATVGPCPTMAVVEAAVKEARRTGGVRRGPGGERRGRRKR